MGAYSLAGIIYLAVLSTCIIIVIIIVPQWW